MDKKKKEHVWIINHYASCPDFPNEHRHHDFAKELVRRGYDVTVFAASTMHNMGVNLIEGNESKIERFYDGVRYVFIKCRSYQGNGLARLLNMRDYIKALPEICLAESAPDVIWASSPQLFALKTALDIAEKMQVPCVCEVRDLWPQSLIEYGYLPKKSPIARALFRMERRAYERADALIFTMEGGKDYICDRGWDTEHGGKVDLDKVHYLNNGVDLTTFLADAKEKPCLLPELLESDKKKIVYTGSIRAVNNVGYMLDVAELMRDDDVAFFMVGGGDRLDELRAEVAQRGLKNIYFTGPVDKHEVPAVLKAADLLMVAFSPSNGIMKYGSSPNKLFEYLASGKPMLSNMAVNYSIIEKYNCGIERSFSGADEFADAIRSMTEDQDLMKVWAANSSTAAKDFSFERLTQRLVELFEAL